MSSANQHDTYIGQRKSPSLESISPQARALTDACIMFLKVEKPAGALAIIGAPFVGALALRALALRPRSALVDICRI